MLCKCRWIVLYIVHVTAFCLGGPFFSGHGVYQVQLCSVLGCFLRFCRRFSHKQECVIGSEEPEKD